MDEVAVVRLGLMAYRVPLEVVLEVVLGVERTVCAPTVTREVSMAHAPTRPAAAGRVGAPRLGRLGRLYLGYTASR